MKGKGKASIWTPELVERLLKLWEQGLSATEIARELGMGLTRNAVIGKIHRLRNAGKAPERRENDNKKKTAQAAPARRKAAAPRKPAAPASNGALALARKAESKPQPEAEKKPAVAVAHINTGLVKDIMDLNHKTCRWPIGDPGEEGFCYCGRDVEDGHPYCKDHVAVAYQGAHEKRRAAG